MAPAQVRPAPNPADAMTSPFCMLPARTASSRAKGIEAAEVFPYSLRLDTTLQPERVSVAGIYNLPNKSRLRLADKWHEILLLFGKRCGKCCSRAARSALKRHAMASASVHLLAHRHDAASLATQGHVGWVGGAYQVLPMFKVYQ